MGPKAKPLELVRDRTRTQIAPQDPWGWQQHLYLMIPLRVSSIAQDTDTDFGLFFSLFEIVGWFGQVQFKEDYGGDKPCLLHLIVSCNHSLPVCAVSDGMNQSSSSRTMSREQFSLQPNVTALKCGLIRTYVSEPVRFSMSSCHCLWSNEVLRWLICIVANCLTSLSFSLGFE